MGVKISLDVVQSDKDGSLLLEISKSQKYDFGTGKPKRQRKGDGAAVGGHERGADANDRAAAGEKRGVGAAGGRAASDGGASTSRAFDTAHRAFAER